MILNIQSMPVPTPWLVTGIIDPPSVDREMEDGTVRQSEDGTIRETE